MENVIFHVKRNTQLASSMLQETHNWHTIIMSLILTFHVRGNTQNYNVTDFLTLITPHSEQPSVKQSLNGQDAFWPIPGLLSCAGVTGSVGVLHHARTTQMTGLIESSMLGSHK